MAGKCAIINAKCPETSDVNARVFCPLWNDSDEHFIETNIQTGQQRITRCAARVLIKGMIHTIKAADAPSVEINEVRNEIAKGFAHVAEGVARLPLMIGKRDGS